MWPDNETDLDYVNFEGVADTVAAIIDQADRRPVSVGISGAWGIGKSTMIKLTRAALEARDQSDDGEPRFIFVEFNAWLYQGYDDARAALLDVIASRLMEEAEARATAVDKVTDFVKRVRWLRLAKLIAFPALAMMLGLPQAGVIGSAVQLVGDINTEKIDDEEVAQAEELVTEAGTAGRGLIDPKQESSPPREIQALRRSFESALEELDVTLVVLIDDLDRCLPETAISTLEAIRLFLFLQNTAFVIAADEQMIRHAVSRHFGELADNALVTNYFDKLIQIPIRVPALGTQEVRAYMMLLYVESSVLSGQQKRTIRDGVIGQLKQAWQGKRVDRAFIQTLEPDLPTELRARLDSAERLSSIMTTATGIGGNPRLVKRFMNALAIRMTISDAQGVGVDEQVLAKLLLFERLAPADLYAQLTAAVTRRNGTPDFLNEWETAVSNNVAAPLPTDWDKPFLREWLSLPPQLGKQDLRGALYVSREHAPLITPEDRLSSDGAAVLTGLLENPSLASALHDNLARLPKTDVDIVMERLLSTAQQEQVWGTPAILDACIEVANIDTFQGERLAGFLIERPENQIRAAIVPRIADYAWASAVLKKWSSGNVSAPVKRAMTQRGPHGNVKEQ